MRVVGSEANTAIGDRKWSCRQWGTSKTVFHTVNTPGNRMEGGQIWRNRFGGCWMRSGEKQE